MIISGRYGSVGGISQVADWSIDLVSTDNAQANSFTRAGKVRDEGVCDWTGNFNTVGTLALETLDSFSFSGRTGAATFTGTGMTYSGNAMIQSIAITGDLSAGGRVTTAVTFGGNGKLTKAAGSGVKKQKQKY